jgi:hypothetical protein
MRERRRVAAALLASAVLTLACCFSAYGQGNGKGKGNKSSPPSSSPLPSTGGGGLMTSGASPLAWIDDASILTPGTMALTISTMRWWGADLTERNFPVVDVAVGLTPRVQLGASVPHIVGNADGTGQVGGFGTSYISGKFLVVTGTSSGVQVAVAPAIEILGIGAEEALASGDSRTQFGLPLSVEIARGRARMFASTGFFTRGVWFAGGGAGVQATSRLAVSLSFSRAWAGDAVTSLSRDRRELSGGASYFVKSQMAVFGSLGRTIATTDADGAGTMLSGGVMFLLTPASRKSISGAESR